MGIVTSVIGFVGKNLLTKEKLNDKELSEAREKVCKGCKHYDADNDQCKICLCIIGVKVESKVSINPFHLHYEETHCPIGKWPIRLEDGSIGGNDLEIAKYYRKGNKNKLGD